MSFQHGNWCNRFLAHTFHFFLIGCVVFGVPLRIGFISFCCLYFATRAHAHWILLFYYYVIGNLIQGYISINSQFWERKRIYVGLSLEIGYGSAKSYHRKHWFWRRRQTQFFETEMRLLIGRCVSPLWLAGSLLFMYACLSKKKRESKMQTNFSRFWHVRLQNMKNIYCTQIGFSTLFRFVTLVK